MPLLPLHLRQGGFYLGQPEGHIHGAVQLNSGGQGAAGRSGWPTLAYSVPSP